MSLSSERVKKWRRESKSVIVEGFGGKCAICSYNKCHDAFDLHHLDPSKKNFGIAGIRANPKKWELIKKELENLHQKIYLKSKQFVFLIELILLLS